MSNRWGNNGNGDRLYLLGSEITADGDYSHAVKRRLLLGRKAMTNLVVLVTQSCVTLCDPMDCSLPGFPVHGFSRQEYLSGLPFPSPADLPDPRIESSSPAVPALAGRFFTTEPLGKPFLYPVLIKYKIDN